MNNQNYMTKLLKNLTVVKVGKYLHTCVGTLPMCYRSKLYNNIVKVNV